MSPRPRSRLALVFVASALTACRAPAAPGAPPAGRARITAEPTVRVGIVVDSPQAAISASSAFELVGSAGQVLGRGTAGAQWVVTADHELAGGAWDRTA